jgi:processing peptidase subunit alpha
VQTRNFGFFGKKPDNEDKIQLKKYIDGDASVALDRRRRRETIESRFPPLTSVPKEIAETLSTQPLEPPKTEITTLSNGARVGTEENYSVSSSIALFFHAGTRFEQPHNYGISHLIERMAFKSTATRTAAEVTHVLEDLGANVSISSTRELMTYNADILRVHVPTVMEVMADAIKNPQFTDEELAEQLEVIEYEAQETKNAPETFLPELLHKAAYGSGPLGNSLLAYEGLRGIKQADLFDYVRNYYVGNRLVIAGVGVDHSSFVKLSQNYFGDLPAQGPTSIPPSSAQYFGGLVAESAPDDIKFAHVAVAFNSASVVEEDFFAFCTLQTLLGGGGSFSAGGPGKGMYSRLYADVLGGYSWTESVEAMHVTYQDSGLFGIYGTAPPRHMLAMMQVIIDQFVLLVKQGVTATELNRAKNQLKCNMFMNLESRAILADDIGRQIMWFKQRFSGEELCTRIDALSAADLQRVAQRLLSTAPSIAVYAPQAYLDKVPDYDSFADYIKAHLAQK